MTTTESKLRDRFAATLELSKYRPFIALYGESVVPEVDAEQQATGYYRAYLIYPQTGHPIGQYGIRFSTVEELERQIAKATMELDEMNATSVPHSVMASQIEAAVLAERERCAKIAESAMEGSPPMNATEFCKRREQSQLIAEEIRKG